MLKKVIKSGLFNKQESKFYICYLLKELGYVRKMIEQWFIYLP